MQEIGQLLRELRIKKGLSIEDIQEITKIRSRYIQAIEEGNLEKLPGQFYAKAFIKTYAEVVELDPEIVKEYQGKLPTPEFNNVQVKPRFQSNNSSTKISKWLFVSLVYVLIALVILSIYIFYVSYSEDNKDDLPGDPIDQRFEVDDSKKDSNQSTDQGTDTTNDPGKTNEDEQKNKDENEDIQITRTSTDSSIKGRPHDIYEVVVPNGEEIKVQLKFTGKCWFDVRNSGPDGKQLLTATLNAGQETDVFTLNERLWMLLGSASGAELYINGQKFTAGDDQSPKYITIIKKAE